MIKEADIIVENWGAMRSFIEGDREGRRWNREAYSETEKCLTKIFTEGASLSESTLNHFLTGYQAYCQLLPPSWLAKGWRL